MAAPFIAAAVALAEFVPVLSRWFSKESPPNSSSEMIAARVVEIAKKMTGQSNALGAVEFLKSDASLLVRFQREIMKLDHDLEAAFLGDKQNARARDIAFVQAGRHNIRADIMVICAALGLVFCLVTLTAYEGHLPGEAVGIISTIAGIFGACLKDAYSFEFGSSRGSKTKDLNQILNHLS
tara:strand:+ start:630 stop:1172 length:543 start_codon:yes stop_codon:yes gene_type:complete